MSYVRMDTSNPLGRRNLGRLGDNPPYPVYRVSRSVARLNGDFNADPGTNPNGALTYRIDPRTGSYAFYRTDIAPRGVFQQNTFQHPATPTLSALGQRVLPIGKSVSASTLVRGRTLYGLGCASCGGRCNAPMAGLRGLRGMRGFRGLGVPDFPGACGPQSDGSIIPCPADPSMATEQGDVALPGVTPTVVAPPPGTTIETIINPGNPIAQGIQQVFTALNPPRVVAAAPAAGTSFFNQSSSIAGLAVPNLALVAGGVMFAALFLEGSKKRR